MNILNGQIRDKVSKRYTIETDLLRFLTTELFHFQF